LAIGSKRPLDPQSAPFSPTEGGDFAWPAAGFPLGVQPVAPHSLRVRSEAAMRPWFRSLFHHERATPPALRPVGEDEIALWLLCAGLARLSPGAFPADLARERSWPSKVAAFRRLARRELPRWTPREAFWTRLAEGELNFEANFSTVREADRARAAARSAASDFQIAQKLLPAFVESAGREHLGLADFFMLAEPVCLGPFLADARAHAQAVFESAALERDLEEKAGARLRLPHRRGHGHRALVEDLLAEDDRLIEAPAEAERKRPSRL
jgi:hypothetical protein